MEFTAEFPGGERRDFSIPVTSDSPDYEQQIESLRYILEEQLMDVLNDVFKSFWMQLRLQVAFQKDMGSEKELFWWEIVVVKPFSMCTTPFVVINDDDQQWYINIAFSHRYYLPKGYVVEADDIPSVIDLTIDAVKQRIQEQELRGSGWIFEGEYYNNNFLFLAVIQI